MIQLKTQVNRLLEELYINHLWNIQQKKNPIRTIDMDVHCKDLINACKPIKQVVNRAKFRALIKLGIIKSTTPINKKDNYISVKLTHFGLIICKELLFEVAPSFKLALLAEDPVAAFWDNVMLRRVSEGGYFGPVSAQYVPPERFKRWILHFPHIKKVIPFINNRKKVEKYINMLFKAVLFVEDNHHDRFDDLDALQFL